MHRKPTRKGLAAIYRQEIIQDVTLFTSQRAAYFYDKLFSCLDFTLPRAATGRRGFPKEAMVCAFIVMKCEGFAQITDLADYLDNDCLIAHYYGFNIMEPLPSYWTYDHFLKKMDIAYAVTGKARGGPAKMAVVASGLMGMISGSSTANVVSTGTYTIPLMKKTGYRPVFAGAVEAAASTGGQIMPPVMGAASFLLAEYVGISYISLCAIAAIPAVLYFIAVFTAVHFEAVRAGLKGVETYENARSWKWLLLHQGYLATPIFVILITMVLGFSAYKAALYSILAIIIILLFEKRGKVDVKGLIDVQAAQA